jgi:hypothetical protein
MHSPDATWETGLVIPETSKPIDVQTLDVLLRIEEQLVLLNSRLAPSHTDLMVSPEAIDEALAKPTKGKRK